MAKLTIKYDFNPKVTKQTAIGPSKKWLDKNANRPDVLRAVRTAFSKYLKRLGASLKKQYLSTAPKRSRIGANENSPSSHDVVASYVGQGSYHRAKNLPYGNIQGRKTATLAGEAPPNGVISGKLANSIGKPIIKISGGKFKIIFGPDLQNIPLDFYLHKTLVNHHDFPKLKMPSTLSTSSVIFKQARLDAMKRLKNLENRDKQKK